MNEVGSMGSGRESRRTRRHRTHETKRNISRTWREPEHHRQELQCRSRHDLKTGARVKFSEGLRPRLERLELLSRTFGSNGGGLRIRGRESSTGGARTSCSDAFGRFPRSLFNSTELLTPTMMAAAGKPIVLPAIDFDPCDVEVRGQSLASRWAV